jgi:ABC-type phosphate/phosphonate transport system substrate-binding protein
MSDFIMKVCPHDTASNPERWFLVVQYLAQKLGSHIQFDISLDFTDFHQSLTTADLVYANPTDSIDLMDRHGFVAVARPDNHHDEVVFVANIDVASPSLQSFHGAQVATVPSMMPTKIALHIFKDKGIEPAGLVDCDSWTGVVGALWRNELQLGLVYKDTYDELSEQGREMINAFETSNEQIAFHNFMVGGNALERKDEIARVLLEMHTDDKGKEVLQELAINYWKPTSPEELAKIKHIMESYQGG